MRRRRGSGRHRRRRAVHLRHPQGAAQRGARRLRRSPARPAVPRRRLDRAGTTCCAGCTTPPTRSRSPWSASTSTCPTPTCRSPRRCAPAASPTTPRCDIRWVASDECESPGGCREAPRRRRRGLRPGRLRHPRHRGQARRAHLRPQAQDPDPGSVPRPAVHGDRVRPQRGRPREASSTEFDPDSPDPVIATMDEQKAFVEGAGDLGGTMRLGLYPADADRGLLVRRGLRRADRIEERHRHRYEVNNGYRDQLEAAGLVFSGTFPTRAGGVRRAAARRAPVLRRHPGAPRAAVAADPAASAVRRAGRRRHRAADASCASRSTSPDCDDATPRSGCGHEHASSAGLRADAGSILRTVRTASRFCRMAGCVPGTSAGFDRPVVELFVGGRHRGTAVGSARPTASRPPGQVSAGRRGSGRSTA